MFERLRGRWIVAKPVLPAGRAVETGLRRARHADTLPASACVLCAGARTAPLHRQMTFAHLRRAIDGRPWAAAPQRKRKSSVLRLRSGRELKAAVGDESVATTGGTRSNDGSQARRVAATRSIKFTTSACRPARASGRRDGRR
jgi:hypothetical protein